MNKKGQINWIMIGIGGIILAVLFLTGSLFTWVLKLAIPKLLGAAVIIFAVLGAVGIGGLKLNKKLTVTMLIVGSILFVLPYIFTGLGIPLSVMFG